MTRTTVWSDGQILSAAALNGEFNNLLNALNIVNADISAGAAIAPSKITFGGTNGQYLTSNGSGGLVYVNLPVTTLNRAFGFSSPGVQSVANDVSWNPTSPQAMTAIKIWAHCKTAPTSASLTVQVYNITQSHVVASVSISASGTDVNSTSMANAAIAAGDVLRLDVTNIGSGVAGSDVTVVIESTQP